MKLQYTNDAAFQHAIHIQDLRDLLNQPAYSQLRPCANCKIPCRCSASAICPCRCGPDCAHASVAMSTDGDRYPIEEKIVPLVFCLNCLRVCQPYWSCEGHRHAGNQVVKVPQVWFHARSLMYPKLIAEHLAALNANKSIHCPWQVCVTYVEENLEAGFSIKPDLALVDKPCLKSMQRDVNVIAESFVAGVRRLASDYIHRYESRDARSADPENRAACRLPQDKSGMIRNL